MYVCIYVYMRMSTHSIPRSWVLVENIIELYSKTRFSYLMYPDRLYPWDRHLYGTRSKGGGGIDRAFSLFGSPSRLSSLALARGQRKIQKGFDENVRPSFSLVPKTVTCAKKTIPIVAPEYIRRLPSAPDSTPARNDTAPPVTLIR